MMPLSRVASSSSSPVDGGCLAPVDGGGRGGVAVGGGRVGGGFVKGGIPLTTFAYDTVFAPVFTLATSNWRFNLSIALWWAVSLCCCCRGYCCWVPFPA
jgi:hypothetical protein